MTNYNDNDEKIRKALEAFEHMAHVISAALTERVINFGLQHGLSLQEMQCLTPRKEDGSPDSFAGAVLDSLVERTKSNS